MRTKSMVPGIAGCVLAMACGMAAAQSATRVVNEGGIRDQWMLADGVKLAAPGYPAEFAARGDNVCVAVGYRINPNGSTGEFVMLRGWSSSGGDKEPEAGYWDSFSQASAAALSEWRFKPRPEVGTPRAVDTVATMTFMGKEAQDAAVLRGHCQVDDLASLLEQVKSENLKRGDMNRHTIENNYRQTVQNEARANQARRGAGGSDHR